MVARAMRLLRHIELCKMYADAYEEWTKTEEGLDWEAVATTAEES